MRAEWVLVLAVNSAVFSGPQALGQQACKPTMKFIEAHYSAMQLPKLQRTWTAELSVDASHCQTLSGRFEIVYSMEKESAPDYEVREQLTWVPGSMKVSKEFWVDEAAAAYRIDNIGHALAANKEASPPIRIAAQGRCCRKMVLGYHPLSAREQAIIPGCLMAAGFRFIDYSLTALQAGK